jgi:tetratricopeptide (TPR) repeat protein
VRIRWRRLLAVAVLAIGGWARWRAGQLDSALAHPTVAGLTALAHYEIGDYAGAARTYRRELAEAFTTRGLTVDDPEFALLLGDDARAATLATAELARDPGAVAPRLALAEVALDDGHHDDALATLREALAIAPDDVDAQTLTGIVHARAGHDDEAIAWTNRALFTYRPLQRWSTWLQLLAATGDLAAREPAPACVLAHLHRYLRVYDTGQGATTITWAERAIARGDRPDAAWICIGIVRTKEVDDEGALDAFRQAIARNPANVGAYHWAAVVHAQRGELEDELAMRRRGHESDPANPMAGLALSTLVADKLGDEHEALRIDEEILASGQNRAVLLHAGRIYGESGDFERALSYFRKAVEGEPGDPRARASLAWALSMTGRANEAIAEYRRAVQLDASYVHAHMGLMFAYRDAGRFDDAVREIETAFQLDPTERWHQIELCDLLLLAGRFDEARRCGQPLLFRDSPTSEATFLATFSLLSGMEAKGQ